MPERSKFQQKAIKNYYVARGWEAPESRVREIH